MFGKKQYAQYDDAPAFEPSPSFDFDTIRKQKISALAQKIKDLTAVQKPINDTDRIEWCIKNRLAAHYIFNSPYAYPYSMLPRTEPDVRAEIDKAILDQLG